MWSSWWNENWQGKPKYLEKTHCRGGKPVTKYGTSVVSGIYMLFTAVMYT
jgi:hypothetical protein